jgi:stearoyl-CoA desaturase (delta-9 desaturase)
MSDWLSTERVRVTHETCAMQGTVRVQWAEVAWVLGHGFLGLWGVLDFAQWDAGLVFLALTAVTICAGHSVGMHRLLIHRSFPVDIRHNAKIFREKLSVWAQKKLDTAS